MSFSCKFLLVSEAYRFISQFRSDTQRKEQNLKLEEYLRKYCQCKNSNAKKETETSSLTEQ